MTAKKNKRQLRLWNELEAIKWEFNFQQEFDKTSYHTVERVQEQMYSSEHITEAFEQLPTNEKNTLLAQLGLILLAELEEDTENRSN